MHEYWVRTFEERPTFMPTTAREVLPQFPEFAPLSLDQRDLVQGIANAFPSSDFNFASLYAWDVEEQVGVSQHNGNLVIYFTDYMSHERFISFIGDTAVDATIDALIAFSVQAGLPPQLTLIPESVLPYIQNASRYSIVADRDNYDYILSVNDLVEFKATKYRGKRNLLNRYIKKYGALSDAVELNLDDDAIRDDVFRAFESWRVSRNKDHDEVNDELIAIKRAIEARAATNMRAFCVRHDDDLIAFTLFEVLPTRVGVIHFDKADISYVGIFQYLKHTFGKHLSASGVLTINYEQDLGVPGLRTAKESYHPIAYIKKYSIEFKQ